MREQNKKWQANYFQKTVTKSVKSTKCEKAQITTVPQQRSSQFTDYEHTDNYLQCSSINAVIIMTASRICQAAVTADADRIHSLDIVKFPKISPTPSNKYASTMPLNSSTATNVKSAINSFLDKSFPWCLCNFWSSFWHLLGSIQIPDISRFLKEWSP